MFGYSYRGLDIIAIIPNNDVYIKCQECAKCTECKPCSAVSCPACQICNKDNSTIFYGIIGGLGCFIIILIFVILFISMRKNKKKYR